MKNKIRLFIKSQLLIVALFLTSSLSHAQVTLVEWVDFFGFEPPISATSYLPMNSGRPLSGNGQSAPPGVPTLFITSAPWDFTHMIFASNGWNVGASVANFNFNFATTNYSNVEVSFDFGILSDFGPRNFKAQYSVSSSSGPWTDVGVPFSYLGSVPPNGLSSTPTMTLPAACNNVPNVWIRIVTTDGSLPSGYTGGPYIHNVNVAGFAMDPATITSHPSSAVICEGSGTVFSITADDAVTYQWEYRATPGDAYIDVPDNATYDNVTTSSLTINDATVSMNGYEYRCRVTGGTPPDALSNAAVLTVNAYGTWNGSVNTDWNNAANWNCTTIPDASTDVFIPAGLSNYPIISGSTDAICNDITISTGAHVIVSGTGSIEIKGEVSIATSTLVAHDGEVIFSGLSEQTIPGIEYKNLVVSSSSLKSLSGHVFVNQTLTLTLGKIILNTYNISLLNDADIMGGADNSYLITNSSGRLINNNIGVGGKTGNVLFPIGTSSTSYSPLLLNNAGTADNFSVGVGQGVFETYSGTEGVDVLTEDAVDKTWYVTEAVPGGTNATIQLVWYASDELPGFSRDNCAFSHYNGSFWEPQPLAAALGFNPYFIIGTGITSFSPFGVGGSPTVLQVDLLSFEANPTLYANELTWTMTESSDVKSFEIERSLDSRNFETIAELTPRNNQNNSFKYSDEFLNSAYYRLKINGVHGDVQYSHIAQVSRDINNIFTVFPNPASHSVTIQCAVNEETEVHFSLYNIQGAQVLEKISVPETSGNHSFDINIEELPTGIYYYNAIVNGQTYNGSVIKR